MFRKRKSLTRETNAPEPTKVFAYRSYRSSPGRNTNTGRMQQERSKAPAGASKRRHWLSIATFIVISGALLSVLFLGGSPRVRVIQTDGGIQRTDAAAYEKEIGDIWRKPLNNWTKLTANTDAASEEILSMFPELSSAHIELPLIGRRPLVTLRTTPAVATITNITGAYYVASDGKILSQVNGDFAYSGAEPLVAVTDNSGLQPKAGEYVLNSDQVQAIRTYAQGFESYDIGVQDIVLPTEVNQINIRLKSRPYYVKFNFLEDPRQSIGAFIAAQKNFSSTGEPTEYVDVRIPEKVFYK